MTLREKSLVNDTVFPCTVASLIEDFQRLGLQKGDTVLVHSSLSSMGWVCDGAVTVVEALIEAVGAHGTLMMPTHTTHNTEPAHWENPPVPEARWSTIRNDAPAFNAHKTPSRGMGIIAEIFRTFPETTRSNHPIGSFAARGPRARELLDDGPIEPMFGDDSPIGRLYQADGKVLLLGVDYSSCTSLHLAEYRAQYKGKKYIQEGCAVLEEGERRWKCFEMLSLCSDDFGDIGKAFEAHHEVQRHRIGAALAKFFSQRALVNFAVDYMEHQRGT